MSIPAYIGKAYNQAVERVTVPDGHGFVPLDCIRWTGSAWVKASALTENTIAQAVVVAVISPTQFDYAYAGRFRIPGHGLKIGETYYLSNVTPGLLVDDQPTFGPALIYAESVEVIEILSDATVSEVGNMTPASTLTGAEIFPLVQGGVARRATAQDVSGDPQTTRKGLARNRAKGYVEFANLAPSLAGVVSGGILPNEPMAVVFGGGAVLSNPVDTLFSNAVRIATSGTVEGWGYGFHTEHPALFIPGTSDLDVRVNLALSAAPTSGQDFITRVGFIKASGTKTGVTTGILLEGSYAAGPTWRATVKNAGGTESVDTGVSVTAAAMTLRVKYEGAAARSRFWINGTEMPPILDATRAVDIFSALRMVCSIEKTVGATSRHLDLYGLKYDNARAEFAHFA